MPDAKPGNVEEEVEEQLNSAGSRVVIEELVSCNAYYYAILGARDLWLGTRTGAGGTATLA